LKYVDPSTDGQLVYRPQLHEAAQTYAQHENGYFKAMLDSTNSIDHESTATDAAQAYMVRIADNINNATTAEEHDLWSTRFTQASIELYGQPNVEKAVDLMHQEQRWLQSLAGREDIDQSLVSGLLAFYDQQVGSLDDSALEQAADQSAVFEGVRDLANHEFAELLELWTFEDGPDLTPEDLYDETQKGLDWLKAKDSQAWEGWTVVQAKAATFTVDSSERELQVPMLASPFTPFLASSTLVHEVLVHANRSNHGAQTGDEALRIGLPGYSKFEESLAIFYAEACVGFKDFPPRRHHYMNIAMALGLPDREPLSRQELLQVQLATVTLQAQDLGRDQTPEALQKTAYSRVNRIFRGASGGDLGSRDAVFTKDMVYYHNYQKVIDFIAKHDNLAETLDYIMSAKFDPTNPDHQAYVLEKTGRSLN
jgi:hypothetical protein